MNRVIVVSNRRLAHRHNLATHLSFRVLGSNVPEQRAQSLNVSARGVYFATDGPVAKGAVVQVLVKMPEEITGRVAMEWRCTGHVVRVLPIRSVLGSFGVGVGFDFYEILPPVELMTH